MSLIYHVNIPAQGGSLKNQHEKREEDHEKKTLLHLELRQTENAIGKYII
jgi:hypothetical protein